MGLLGAHRAFLHFVNYDLQEKYIQTITQISHRKNVLDAAASEIDGFLWIGTYVSTTYLNRPICNKMSLSQN
jgi:hypothetical protein